ncbi:plastocyanin [Aromatoleum toluvorans]|uniref:Plastocyanin n=1 Tax=Aromatoleum toluvorans TaxID=92002 RepID=A0ABX1Q0G9_9RHOO|nr:plastocyanin/azurin family copper-binding protein [Aromatoleum toluvorans]NMG45183.1 plastocyanin [Aromatoleum toluvorans]
MRALHALAVAATGLVLLHGGAALAADHEIAVAEYKFHPAELRVAKGDKVTWINREKRTSHSVLFDAGGEESARFFPGETWSRTFSEGGRFEYHCGPHPEMKGVVIVGD